MSSNNNILYVSSDETKYNPVRTRVWAYGREKNYHYTGLQRPFTVSSHQRNDEVGELPELVEFTVNGTGAYGGNIRPLTFYLDLDDVNGLINMFEDVKKSMKQS